MTSNAVSLVSMPLCIFTVQADYDAYRAAVAPNRAQLWDGKRWGFIFEGVFYTTQR